MVRIKKGKGQTQAEKQEHILSYLGNNGGSMWAEVLIYYLHQIS